MEWENAASATGAYIDYYIKYICMCVCVWLFHVMGFLVGDKAVHILNIRD